MIKKISLVCLAMMAVLFWGLATPVMAKEPPQETGCKTTGPLGIPTWYRGLTSGNCEIEWPDGDTEKSFQKFITVIALNVSEMVLRLSGVMAVLFIVFGGFKYMLAQGDSSKVAGAKKTITNAVIGLAISLLSVVIVNTIFNLFK